MAISKRAPDSTAQLLHDLNNALLTVIVDAQLIAAVIQDGPEHEEALEIYDAGRRAAAIVAELGRVLGPDAS
jgi:hypothetical protein